jgi:nitroreductase
MTFPGGQTLADDILALIRGRRSVRSYTSEPVEEATLLQLIEAGRWAPSAANGQPWSFITVRSPETIRLLGNLADFVLFNSHVRRARAIIVVCADPRGSRYYQMDCALAVQNILLTAHAQGLGGCFVGAFDEEGIKRALAVPGYLRIVGLVTLGWPAEDPATPPRLALEEILKHETYSGNRPPSIPRRLTNAVMFSLAKRVFRRRRAGRQNAARQGQGGDRLSPGGPADKEGPG